MTTAAALTDGLFQILKAAAILIASVFCAIGWLRLRAFKK